MDVTADIERHLKAASELAVLARGYKPGKYIIIAQVVIGPDKSFFLTWNSYESDTDEVR